MTLIIRRKTIRPGKWRSMGMNASWHCRFHPRINRTADTASAREDPTSFRLGIIDYSSRLDMILLCRHEGTVRPNMK